jgi:Icc protein
VHQQFDGVRRNGHGDLRLMATPSSCVQFLPRADDFALDDRPPGYRQLVLHADGRIDTQVQWLE